MWEPPSLADGHPSSNVRWNLKIATRRDIRREASPSKESGWALMIQVRWDRYPRTAEFDLARRWVTIQVNLGLARNTIDAYSRALEDYLGFSQRQCANVTSAGRDHIAAYVHDLTSRPIPEAPSAGRSALKRDLPTQHSSSVLPHSASSMIS